MNATSVALASQRPARSRLLRTAVIFLLIVLALVGIQTFVTQPYQIQQGDMATSLMPGQYLLIDRLTPRWAPYARGDIVVFDPPGTWSSSGAWPFVKRVIGLPGDQIALRAGVVFVNGAPLEEGYLSVGGAKRPATEPSPGGATEWVVPDGSLFVLGDARAGSADSRNFGPIRQSDVVGRAWLRFWPIDRFGPI